MGAGIWAALLELPALRAEQSALQTQRAAELAKEVVPLVAGPTGPGSQGRSALLEILSAPRQPNLVYQLAPIEASESQREPRLALSVTGDYAAVKSLLVDLEAMEEALGVARIALSGRSGQVVLRMELVGHGASL